MQNVDSFPSITLPEVLSQAGQDLTTMPSDHNFEWQHFTRSKVSEIVGNPVITKPGEVSEMKK